MGYPETQHQLGPVQVFDDNKLMAIHYTNRACLPIKRIPRQIVGRDEPETSAFWDNPDAIYGKILPYADDPTGQPEDIKGISGGPLVGLQLDPDGASARYRLYGVQSRWLDITRTIRVEPTLPFIQVLEQAATEQDTEAS